MDKNELLDMICQALVKSDYACEICMKSGHKCPVYIPDDADINFKPDFSVCDFRCFISKTLTTS